MDYFIDWADIPSTFEDMTMTGINTTFTFPDTPEAETADPVFETFEENSLDASISFDFDEPFALLSEDHERVLDPIIVTGSPSDPPQPYIPDPFNDPFGRGGGGTPQDPFGGGGGFDLPSLEEIIDCLTEWLCKNAFLMSALRS